MCFLAWGAGAEVEMQESKRNLRPQPLSLALFFEILVDARLMLGHLREQGGKASILEGGETE